MKRIFSRFLPAVTTMFGLVAGGLVLADPHGLSPIFAQIMLAEIGGIAFGYGAALATLEAIGFRRQGADRMHAIAGIVAPILLGAMSPFVQAIDRTEIFSLSLAAGIVTGLLFWVGLNRKPVEPKPSLEELEEKADAELVLLDPTWRDRVQSINSPSEQKRSVDRVA